MKKTTDIWLYIIVGLMSAEVLLVTATSGIIKPSYEYERGIYGRFYGRYAYARYRLRYYQVGKKRS